MTVVEMLRDMINRQKRLDIAMYGSNNAEYNQKKYISCLIR